MSWASALADHLDHGGPMALCATCHRPHTVALVHWRGAVGVVTEAAVDAAIGRLEAVLDGRRPEDCGCKCCAEVKAGNGRALAEAVADASQSLGVTITTEATCQHCGSQFPRRPGREPKYCCAAHRQAAWQARSRPTMSQERRQASGAATAELAVLRAQVAALAERVERLEVGTDDGQPVGESSPPNHVTTTDDHPARTRTSGKPWAVIRTPAGHPDRVAWVYSHHTTELAATRYRDRLARQGQGQGDAGQWRWSVVEDRAGELVNAEDDHG